MSTIFNTLIPVLLFYFLYLGFMALVKSYNRSKVLKFLAENNLLDSMNQDNATNIYNILSGDLKQETKSTNKHNLTLTISLGLMGLAIGAIVGALLMIPLMNVDFSDNRLSGLLREAIMTGLPIFFAAGGVLISYFMTAIKS